MSTLNSQTIERKPATEKEAIEALNLLEPFMSYGQWHTLARNCGKTACEEFQYFRDRAVELAETINNMPKTYETDGQGNNAIAYLHYFIGGFDWYITEKDMENPQHQAFGLACVHEIELGYISIEDLRKIKKGIAVVELDFNWTPKTLAEIKKK